MGKGVVITADKVRKRKKSAKIIKISLLSLLLLLIVLYIILEIIYNEGFFTVCLTENDEQENNIAIYENLDQPQGKRKLNADKIEFMDNISVKWLPADINKTGEGTHNGENYIAYSFYVENQGEQIVNYWYELVLDDVIKNVDDAVRIMIYRNEEKTIYAKANPITEKPEEGTVAFKKQDDVIVLKQVKQFKPTDIDKFTIVIWLEGDDPECVDSIIGGQLKMHMDITEEHIKN